MAGQLPVSSRRMMSSLKLVPPVVAMTLTPPRCLLSWMLIWLICRANSLVGTMTMAGLRQKWQGLMKCKGGWDAWRNWNEVMVIKDKNVFIYLDQITPDKPVKSRIMQWSRNWKLLWRTESDTDKNLRLFFQYLFVLLLIIIENIHSTLSM